jgi:hypothetical protein
MYYVIIETVQIRSPLNEQSKYLKVAIVQSNVQRGSPELFDCYTKFMWI